MPTHTTWPAEWHPQSAVLLAWPHASTDWATMLDDVEKVYIELVATISRYEKVVMLCVDQRHESHITSLLASSSAAMEQLVFYHVRYNDTWTRDYGPIQVHQHHRPLLLDFTFNGWGNKFDASLDNTVNKQLIDAGAWPANALHQIDYILEGGSIDSDGQGCILTTTACLLNHNRNPLVTREQVEALLAEMLGSTRVLWLDNGHLIGDDTDSHIDMLARFCNPETIVYTTCIDEHDPHYVPLRKMEMELRQFRTVSGAAYKLIPLPIPDPIYDKDGQRLPASYANFLIINHAVLVPVYQDPCADKHAIEQLQGVFPDREVIAIDCKPLIMQHGSLHCASMQLMHDIKH